jgi:hypothetical protein
MANYSGARAVPGILPVEHCYRVKLRLRAGMEIKC